MLAFEAGLAIGLSRFLDPVVCLAAITGAALLLHLRGHSWVAAIAALGFVLGLLTRSAANASCAALLPAGVVVLRIELLEPVTDGVAAAQPLEPRCEGPITLRVREERLLEAGSRWSVEGRWIPARRLGGKPAGILAVRELQPRGRSRSVSAGLRNWIARTSSQLYGARAGLVEALLVGRRGGIDPELNASFARSGLVHLLSISGFHVGVIFGWTLLVLRRLRLRRAPASALATVLVVAYVGFLGWPPPAARAALLCAIGAWCFARQRHPAPMALLALTCWWVTLLDPWSLFDLGFWLSASAFWGALHFTRWSDRQVSEASGWRLLFASLGATLATAPLTAAALGSVALAGIALNFGAIPLTAVAVPAVLLSILLAWLPPVAAWFAAGGGLGLAGLEWLARAGGSLPLAVISEGGVPAALPWLLLLSGAVWVLGRRNTSRRAVLRVGWAVGLLGALSALPLRRVFSADGGSGLALHFLSVGQGDAALIRTAAGRWILVDAGPADSRHDAGRAVLLPFLIRHGVTRLAAFVLSHAHLDHVGGAPTVLRRVPADLILEPAEPVTQPSYLALLELAEEQGSRWVPGRAGDSLVIDGLTLRVLHPDTSWARWRQDLNDDSVVLLLRQGSFTALLTGDLGVRAESLLAGRVGKVDLLKVGHHGSRGSSGAAWLAELDPRAAVISVGVNRYGHPAPEALARLAAEGVEVWRTDRHGSVSVSVGTDSMTLRGRRLVRRYSLEH